MYIDSSLTIATFTMSATPTCRRRLAIFVALALCRFNATAFGFAPLTSSPLQQRTTMTIQKDRSYVSYRSNSVAVILKGSSREEEIAKLEQQLRELKKQEQDDPATTTTTEAAVAAYSDKRKSVVNDRGVREILPGKSMILSEQDLVESQLLDNSSDSKGGVIPTIAFGVIAAVALFFFAQIPVGEEDYIRYSAATTSSKTIDLGDLNMDITR